MTNHWITIAPLHPIWPKPNTFPLKFSERISIDVIPPQLLADDSGDPLRANLIEKLGRASHCIHIEYKADALDANQIQASAEIHLLLLSLWLVKLTPIQIPVIAHIRKTDSSYITRHIEMPRPMLSLISDDNAEHEQADFEIAVRLFDALCKLQTGRTMHVATQAIIKALSEQSVWRFLMLWISLEALFGSTSELSFRLSQRLALFLEQGKDLRLVRFKQVKSSYDLRSKIVHGLNVAKVTPEEGDKQTVVLESIVRSALAKILLDSHLIGVFDSKNDREPYLDGLAFG